MKKDTKYTFEAGTSKEKVTATVTARTRQGAEEKLCQELGTKELPIQWPLTKLEIK